MHAAVRATDGPVGTAAGPLGVLADRRHARELSVLAGAGLIALEAAELGWICFQPLEALFALAGAGVIALAWPRRQERR